MSAVTTINPPCENKNMPTDDPVSCSEILLLQKQLALIVESLHSLQTAIDAHVSASDARDVKINGLVDAWDAMIGTRKVISFMWPIAIAAIAAWMWFKSHVTLS